MIAVLLASLAFGVDLEEARAAAAERAAEVEIARAQADAARARAQALSGQALPELVGFADVTVGSGYTAIGFERPVPWQAGVGVRGTWRLVDPSVWAAASAARRTARGQESMLAWSRVQARQQVTEAYAQVQGQAAIAERLTANAQDAERAWKAIEELVKAGLRPPADAARARADALDLAALAVSARGEARASCATLQGLMAVEVTGDCEVDPVDWASQRPGEGPEVHPALQALIEAESAAKAQAHGAAWTHLPGITASGTAAQYAVPERTGPGWSATVSLDVPLTVVTSGRGEIAAAQADRVRAQAEVDQQARDLAVAGVQSRVRLQAATEGLAARRAGLQASEQAWERVDARFDQGLESLTTWLAARRARIDAEVALARAETELSAALAAVEAARGGL